MQLFKKKIKVGSESLSDSGDETRFRVLSSVEQGVVCRAASGFT